MSEGPKLRFMSQEHVDGMNAALLHSEVVHEACKALGVPRTLTYDLADGPDGELVNWTLRLDKTVQFSLDRPSDPDVLFVGDWKKMIRFTKDAAAEGDPGLSIVGDMDVVLQVGEILEVARAVAGVPTEFPDV